MPQGVNGIDASVSPCAKPALKGVAQLVEHRIKNSDVAGSIPVPLLLAHHQPLIEQNCSHWVARIGPRLNAVASAISERQPLRAAPST
jgi:hypothetical protein